MSMQLTALQLLGAGGRDGSPQVGEGGGDAGGRNSFINFLSTFIVKSTH